MSQPFSKIEITSHPQLNGKYTLRLNFGRESREFVDLTATDLSNLSYGIMSGPMFDDNAREARENDNAAESQ